MKHFTTVNDISNPYSLVQKALEIKKNPGKQPGIGKNKTLGLIFLNPSLRTRLSTQKAAMNLGMQVMVMNIDKEGWALELEDGAIMNGSSVEHIKDAAAIMGLYCDIIGIRCFPGLVDKKMDYSEKIMVQWMHHCQVPVISLESATLHPLQSLADLITIEEHKTKPRPRVVLSWAPHVKAIPQAVPNSFSEWMCKADVEFIIAHPKGYELCEDYTSKASITHHQEEALRDADFIYLKNWSSYTDYGKVLPVTENWIMTTEKWQLSNNAHIMHCLPVRRNVEVPDSILDHKRSLIYQQAGNRVYAAQAVLSNMLEEINRKSQAASPIMEMEP